MQRILLAVAALATIVRCAVAQTPALTVGVIGDLSGLDAVGSSETIVAVEQQLERRLPGVVRVLRRDGQSRPDNAATEAVRFWSDGISIIILATPRAATIAAISRLAELGPPRPIVLSLAIVPDQQLADLRQRYRDRVFAIGDLPQGQAELPAQWLRQHSSFNSRIVVFAPPGYAPLVDTALSNAVSQAGFTRLSLGGDVAALVQAALSPGLSVYIDPFNRVGDDVVHTLQENIRPGSAAAIFLMAPPLVTRGGIVGALLGDVLASVGPRASLDAIASAIASSRVVDRDRGSINIPWGTGGVGTDDFAPLAAAAFRRVGPVENPGNATTDCCPCSNNSSLCTTCQNGQRCSSTGSGAQCQPMCRAP